MCDISDPVAGSEATPRLAFGLARAMARLASLRDDAALGVAEAVACGPAAVPALSRLLFARESSGIYEPRRRAAEALAGLKAYDVLAEYLATPRRIVDPVEETGEEAVMSAAARVLADWPDERVRPLLMALARRAPLAGVIDALSKLRCAEAIPYFIKALADDFTRPAAEEALRSFGTETAPALLEAARSRVPPGCQESVSRLRYRRSALALLAEIGLGADRQVSEIESFIDEQDPALAVLGCRIVLAEIDAESSAAFRRLIALLPIVDLLLRVEIEECLVRHFAPAQVHIAEALQQVGTAPEEMRLTRLLHRVVARGAGSASK